MNKSKAVSFGKYLLSNERKSLLKNHETSMPFKDKVKEVFHADIENWKAKTQ